MPFNFNYLTLGLFVFLFYWIIVSILKHKSILSKYNISAFGPILMIRTKRGRQLLERLAKSKIKKIWRIYADIGTFFVFIAMTLMFFLIILSVYGTFVMHPEPTELNEPRNWLLIPGVNKFIPMCAWIGFVVALVVHELSHAILCSVEKIKVKSMGLLVALLPIGAFAEPDSEELFGEKRKKSGGVAEKKKRVATAHEKTRILSAGVTSNFFIAFIAFLLFFSILFSMQPVNDNMVFVYNVLEGSPAEASGIESGMVIIGINESMITNASVERMEKAMEAKGGIHFTVLDKNGKRREKVIKIKEGYESEGVRIEGIVENSPAAEAGLKKGMRITRIDKEEIKDYKDFQNFMNNTMPGQRIEVETKEGKKIIVELGEKETERDNRGYLGIFYRPYNPLGMVVKDTSEYLENLKAVPFSFASFSPRQWLNGWLWLTVMPIFPPPFGFGGFNPLLSHVYEPVGIATFLGGAAFLVADVLFWTGWINFYVGLFNCLPAMPLDGGYVFRDGIKQILKLVIKKEETKARVLNTIAAFITVFIFLSIFFMLIGPYFI